MFRSLSHLKAPLGLFLSKPRIKPIFPNLFKPCYSFSQINSRNGKVAGKLQDNQNIKNQDSIKLPPKLSYQEFKDFYEQFQEREKDGSLTQQDSENYLNITFNLGAFSKQVQDSIKPETYYRKCVEIAKNANIKNHIIVKALNNLGSQLNEGGRFEEAFQFLGEANEIIGSADLENIDHIIDRNIFMFSMVLKNLGQVEQAQNLFLQGIELIERNPVDTLIGFVLKPYLELGQLFSEIGEFQQAIDIYARGAEFITSNFGEINEIDHLYQSLASALLKIPTEQNKLESARYFEKYKAYVEKHGGFQLPNIHFSADYFHEAGRYEDSLKYCERLYDLIRDNPELEALKNGTLLMMAIVNVKLGNKANALKFYKQSFSTPENQDFVCSEELLSGHNGFFEMIRRDKEALGFFRDHFKAIAEMSKGRSDISQGTLGTFLHWLAYLHVSQDDLSEAEKYIDDCLNTKPESHYNAAQLEKFYRFLMVIFCKMEKFDRAMIFAEKGHKFIKENNFPPEMEYLYQYVIQQLKTNPKEVIQLLH